MKKILVVILLFVLILSNVSAYAEENSTVVEYTADDIRRFQPYTDVDLEVLINAGYKCTSYDDFEFKAFIQPPVHTINYKGSITRYKIDMEIIIIPDKAGVLVSPRFIFSRAGLGPYYEGQLKKIFIKNGENRYSVDAAGCLRTVDSSGYSAKDLLVAPLNLVGICMLRDISLYPQDQITFKMGSDMDVTELFYSNATVINAFKNFYNTCEEAGIFNQEYLLTHSDRYSIITLHNEEIIQVPDSSDLVPDEFPLDIDENFSEGENK